MLSFQTILHPTDFSTNSAAAFQLACSLARDHGARLIVLHVAAPLVAIYGDGIVPVALEPEVQREGLAEQLHQVQPQSGQVRVEHRLADGDPALEILNAAQQSKCDLIVLGTHGRTGLARLLMGSVAEQVVRKAQCPVLTVKTPVPASAASPALKQEPVKA